MGMTSCIEIYCQIERSEEKIPRYEKNSLKEYLRYSQHESKRVPTHLEPDTSGMTCSTVQDLTVRATRNLYTKTNSER